MMTGGLGLVKGSRTIRSITRNQVRDDSYNMHVIWRLGLSVLDIKQDGDKLLDSITNMLQHASDRG